MDEWRPLPAVLGAPHLQPPPHDSDGQIMFASSQNAIKPKKGYKMRVMIMIMRRGRRQMRRKRRR